jgi:hypothetical protein
MRIPAQIMQLCTLKIKLYAQRVFLEYIPGHAQNIPKSEYYSM